MPNLLQTNIRSRVIVRIQSLYSFARVLLKHVTFHNPHLLTPCQKVDRMCFKIRFGSVGDTEFKPHRNHDPHRLDFSFWRISWPQVEENQQNQIRGSWDWTRTNNQRINSPVRYLLRHPRINQVKFGLLKKYALSKTNFKTKLNLNTLSRK